ncbi:hypothetical protein, partial [Brucella anthropi]|uniref:hypothetical protein n=1 Tax=Brucella anthropi TaxID=529 RepID=UPI00384B8EB9
MKLEETFTRTLDVLDAAQKRLQRDPAAADRIAEEIGYQTTPEGRSWLKGKLANVISGIQGTVNQWVRSENKGIYWGDSLSFAGSTAFTIPGDTSRNLGLTSYFFELSPEGRIQTIIHEATHLVARSSDYSYTSHMRVKAEAPDHTSHLRRAKSFTRQTDELRKAGTGQLRFVKNPDFVKSLHANAMPPHQILHEYGIRAHKGEKYTDLFRSHESFRGGLAIRNPDNIANMISALAGETFLPPAGPGPLPARAADAAPREDQTHTDYRDETLLDPAVTARPSNDPDDDTIQRHRDFEDLRRTLSRNPTLSLAADLIDTLQDARNAGDTELLSTAVGD